MYQKNSQSGMDLYKKSAVGMRFIGAYCAGVECITSWFIKSAAPVQWNAARGKGDLGKGFVWFDFIKQTERPRQEPEKLSIIFDARRGYLY